MENDAYTPFEIPESAFGPIRKLIDMKPDDFDAFVLGLASSKPTPTVAGLTHQISRHAPGLEESVISSIISEILTMESLKKEEDEYSAETFIRHMVNASKEAKSENFPFTESDAKCLTDRLTKIFASDHTLALIEKVVTVLTDHTHVYISSKILTDARPIFDDDVTKIEGIAITHTLRIHFEHNQKHEDFYVALDTLDVQNLMHTLDRAERKAELLKETLISSNVDYLDVDPQHDND